ncbi:MAG: DoxX family membrane protein [Anaerolineaceae bacterium]|nr:MAG: DoxX family membrane protein [Anaerolineaceae bacterium]
MHTLFGILTVEQWLALLRIAIGLWWLKSFFHKPLRKFVSGQMVGWTLALADNHPSATFGRFMKKLVGSSPTLFPYLILAGELAVGIGLVFGFLTPISLLVAIFLNLNYISLAGFKPKDISVNAAYQCEQGQNYTMIVSEITLLATISWAVWSVDSLLGWF